MRNSVLLVVVLTITLAGCQTTTQAPPMEGNQAVNRSDTVCLKQDVKFNSQEPKQLYAAMRQCAQMQDYQQAVFLFALAGSYTWYDAASANTWYARNQHTKLLSDAFQPMPAGVREQTWSRIKEVMQDKFQHQSLCQKVEKVGKPVYTPTYISRNKIEHESRQQSIMWPEAINQYLHCDV